MPTCYPPPEEQTAIVEYINQASRDIASTEDGTNREIALLNEYRTRLIADVVTGKLDVREAAGTLAEVDPLNAEAEPESEDDLANAEEELENAVS